MVGRLVGRSVGETGLDWMGLGHFQCCTAVTARSKGRESSSKGGKRKMSTGQLSMFGPLAMAKSPSLDLDVNRHSLRLCCRCLTLGGQLPGDGRPEECVVTLFLVV